MTTVAAYDDREEIRVGKHIRVQAHIPLWGIHRCISDCGGLHRWNRDHNAAINIRNNLLHYLESSTWPEEEEDDDDDAASIPAGEIATHFTAILT